MKINTLTHSFVMLFTALAASAQSTIVIDGSPADRQWKDDGSAANGNNHRLGNYEGAGNSSLVFELPVLSAGESVSSAELAVDIGRVHGAPDFNVDLYGLEFTTIDDISSDFYIGAFTANQSGNVGLVDDFVLSTDGVGIVTSSVTDSQSIGSWIQTFYTNNPSYSGGTAAILRLNPDATSTEPDIGFDQSSANSTGVIPTLSLTVIPEPSSYGAVIGVMACAMVFFKSRRK